MTTEQITGLVTMVCIIICWYYYFKRDNKAQKDYLDRYNQQLDNLQSRIADVRHMLTGMLRGDNARAASLHVDIEYLVKLVIDQYKEVEHERDQAMNECSKAKTQVLELEEQVDAALADFDKVKEQLYYNIEPALAKAQEVLDHLQKAVDVEYNAAVDYFLGFGK